jgi:large subunit ribosomal protein L9
MKVVFVQDVPNVGRMGEVREVADGYGRNFLLPRKLAVLATPSALKEAEAKLQQKVRQERIRAAELVELAQQLEELSITFKEKVASENRLYGSIRDVHIAQEITRITSFDIDKGSVELEEPIRQLGSYEVTIKLSPELKPKIRVIVEGEGEQSEG